MSEAVKERNIHRDAVSQLEQLGGWGDATQAEVEGCVWRWDGSEEGLQELCSR